jgi:hypothetical protein
MSRRLRLAAISAFALTFGLVAAPAAAQVFTEGARSRICVGDRVHLARLAFAVVNEARAAPFAASAPVGAPGTPLTPDDLTTAEALYVLHALVTEPAVLRTRLEEGARAPTHLFGDGPASVGPEALAARKRIMDVLVQEFFPLRTDSKVVGARLRQRRTPAQAVRLSRGARRPLL